MRNVMESISVAIRNIKLTNRWDYSALMRVVSSTAVSISKIGNPPNITMMNRIKMENHKRMLKYAKLKRNHE